MSVTTAADIFTVDKVGELAVDVAFAAVPMLQIPGLIPRVENQVQGARGSDTIKFPFWETDIAGITQDAVRNSRSGVAPSKLKLSAKAEESLTKTISIDVDKFMLTDSHSSVYEHIAHIVGAEFGRVIQDDIVGKALVNGIHFDYSGIDLNIDTVLKSRGKWGDKLSEIRGATLFVRTDVFERMAEDSDYKRMVAGGQYTPIRQEEDWSELVVATINGIRVVLLDSIPDLLDEDEKPVARQSLLVGEGFGGVYVADDPSTEEISHAGSAVKTIDSHFRFATTVFNHNPRRVVRITSAIPE